MMLEKSKFRTNDGARPVVDRDNETLIWVFPKVSPKRGKLDDFQDDFSDNIAEKLVEFLNKNKL